jgi:hypothetical protein
MSIKQNLGQNLVEICLPRGSMPVISPTSVSNIDRCT